MQTKAALLLEDDEFDASITRELLEKCCTPRFDVDRVRSLHDAQEKISRTDYSVALIDMNVPDSQGLETIRNIIQANSETPIVVLSGTDDSAVAIEALRLGAQDYIPKSQLDSRTLQRVIQYAQQRKDLENELIIKAYFDRLTGLGNRALLYERWRRSLARSLRSARMTGVLIIDIDHFKSINDNYGHAAGDAVLQQYARKLSGIIRESDIVARLGGDEFVIVLEAVRSLDEVHCIREKLSDGAAHELKFDGAEIEYTASIGGAVTDPCNEEDLMAVLKRADLELYEHKAIAHAQAERATAASAAYAPQTRRRSAAP